MKTALCPGSFDPITLGHLDVIERASLIFDRVLVCVVVNSNKTPMFTLTERRKLIESAVSHLSNVSVTYWTDLLVDCAIEFNAQTLVKGVRTGTDFDWEFQMAQVNRDLCPTLDTVIFPSQAKHAHISSTAVREILRLSNNPIPSLTGYVPDQIIPVLEEILKEKKG